MHYQSWVATVVFTVIGFGGGYFAASPGLTRAPAAPANDGSPAAAARCYFSPGGGCTAAIVDELNRATRQIELQGYSFTSRPIGDALVAAKRRGLNVTMVLDAAQTSDHRGEAQYVARHGVPVLLDARHAIAHNKVILIDGRVLITGSFNFTRAAEEENAENVLILHDQTRLQSAYEENFRKHQQHAEPFDAR